LLEIGLRVAVLLTVSEISSSELGFFSGAWQQANADNCEISNPSPILPSYVQ